MAQHWTATKVTSGIGENNVGEFVEVNIFTIFLAEFNETKTFTIPEGEEHRLELEVEKWLVFRRKIDETG